MATSGVSQPRNTKVSEPWRSWRTMKSSPSAEKRPTWRSERPPSPIEPSIVASQTSTPAAAASATPTTAPTTGQVARERTRTYAR